MNTNTAVATLQDDSVTVDVDITPLATPTPDPTVTPTPTMAPTPSPSPTEGADLGWLAGTGAEPAWLLVAAAAVLIATGVAIFVARRRVTAHRAGR